MRIALLPLALLAVVGLALALWMPFERAVEPEPSPPAQRTALAAYSEVATASESEIALERPTGEESVDSARADLPIPTRLPAPKLPPELDGPPPGIEGEPDAPESWVRQKLESWESEFADNPAIAQEAAALLRGCTRNSGKRVEDVVAEWEDEDARFRERNPGRLTDPEYFHTQQARASLHYLRVCKGVDEPTAHYIRWLERAARVHPDRVQRERLRLEYAKHAFDDMPSAADRVGSIDEVIRRRDVVVAWVVELREQGSLDAIGHYSVMRSGLGILPTDLVEHHAWHFVFLVRDRVMAEGRAANATAASRPSSAELWRQGPHLWRNDATSAEQLREADHRGREIYRRLFGAPPG